MCTQTRKAGSGVERRCSVTWAFWACSCDRWWEANFVLHRSKALQDKTREAATGLCLRLDLHGQPRAFTYTGQHLSGEEGISKDVHLNRGWHKMNTDTAHDNNRAVQVYPGLASSLQALCIFPFATHHQGTKWPERLECLPQSAFWNTRVCFSHYTGPFSKLSSHSFHWSINCYNPAHLWGL